MAVTVFFMIVIDGASGRQHSKGFARENRRSVAAPETGADVRGLDAPFQAAAGAVATTGFGGREIPSAMTAAMIQSAPATKKAGR